MKKKTIYVVTITYFKLTDFSVDVYIEGYSKELNGAHAILDRSRQKLIGMGYLPECFEIAPWDWIYKHKYGSIKCEIHLVRE